ncbi:hypothetical protein HPB51_002404 [Rhipicephalus microplus]|uniref:Uncharacterized protein n=1 Tax=Rhipicephalus microplus TaxID=6941 RepID=A0A9J6DSP1_RHIMP|nr:hypothetical protein HPB51_002404 [Rhipicephalus microplus]
MDGLAPTAQRGATESRYGKRVEEALVSGHMGLREPGGPARDSTTVGAGASPSNDVEEIGRVSPESTSAPSFRARRETLRRRASISGSLNLGKKLLLVESAGTADTLTVGARASLKTGRTRFEPME